MDRGGANCVGRVCCSFSSAWQVSKAWWPRRLLAVIPQSLQGQSSNRVPMSVTKTDTPKSTILRVITEQAATLSACQHTNAYLFCGFFAGTLGLLAAFLSRVFLRRASALISHYARYVSRLTHIAPLVPFAEKSAFCRPWSSYRPGPWQTPQPPLQAPCAAEKFWASRLPQVPDRQDQLGSCPGPLPCRAPPCVVACKSAAAEPPGEIDAWIPVSRALAWNPWTVRMGDANHIDILRTHDWVQCWQESCTPQPTTNLGSKRRQRRDYGGCRSFKRKHIDRLCQAGLTRFACVDQAISNLCLNLTRSTRRRV